MEEALLVTKTPLEGVMIIEPLVHTDNRGSFSEMFNKKLFTSLVKEIDFVQDSYIVSSQGTLRGLHFQTGESAQYKLVVAIIGSIFDVAIDVRKDSITYGKWIGVILSGVKQLLIPPGFAHGFSSLTESVVIYKTDKYLDDKRSVVLKWDDPDLFIDWHIIPHLFSEKDKNGISFREFSSLE